ncbi:hypothetical protein LY90DRAFT_667205 [Neocallimastix californiae]|uniref:Uncharacterized protein n=1 Tax=Neocallimastix californiae TaxID=1754190 RepID=A0A1Y2EL90_9FUNG|nr:hypothetical protein LY90DRAFT_667205 [Neocallimastix californiae]|eukprot:ORY72330.1 hypothetical protein LY90DRAFT_667205 [Neocallimastix californiae]
MERQQRTLVGDDKLEYELKLELRKWSRVDTPTHIYCKETDVGLPLLGIVVGNPFNIKTMENIIKSEKDSKFDISTMPISNHSIEKNIAKPFHTSTSTNYNSQNNFNSNNINQVKNFTNIVVEKNDSPAVQFIQNAYFPYTHSKNDTSDNFNSKSIEKIENNNSVIIIEKKSRLRIRRDEAGRWYTTGVMVGKTGLEKTQKGDNYAMIQIGNLRDTITNVFLFGKNIEKIKDKKIGQVLAVKSSVALNIVKESQLYTLGNSVDFCYCKAKKKNGKPCTIPLDRREGDTCEYHTISKYKEFRNRRQEFANGNFGFTMEQSNQNSYRKNMGGTYQFNESTVSTYNGKVKLSQYSKNDKKPVITEEDKNFLKKLKQNNSYGINLLKKIGISSKIKEANRTLDKKREEKLLNIHPPEALLKMGIRAPVKKIIKNDINTSKSKLENNIKKEKEFILEFDDEEDKNVSKKLTSISNNESNKREIKISFLSDDENEEDEKNHFKKFLEMKNEYKIKMI